MPGSQTVQSLDRGLKILEAVAASQHGLTLSELTETIGLKPTTVHNLARTLLARNYLVKTSKPQRYRVGGALAAVTEASYQRDLIRRAERSVCAIYNRMKGATVTFCEPVAGQVTMLLRMSSDHAGVLERPRRPMHPYGSASSLVFQAFWTEEERAEYRCGNPFWEHGAYLWKSVEALDAYLAGVRQDGFAMPEALKTNVVLLSAPVFGNGRQLVGALGANLGDASRFDATQRKTIREIVTEAAHELSDSP